MTLQQVSERTGEGGHRIPTSTLVRIEQGRLDPGLKRLRRLLDVYKVPIQVVSDLLELEELAVEPPVGKDLEALYRDGIAYWRAGDIPRGLAHFLALKEATGEDPTSRSHRHKALLGFAIAARNLGKFVLARQLLDELLCDHPEPAILVRGLTLASSVWRGLGSIDVAMALADRAAHLLDATSKPDTAWVLHQKAKLLFELGEIDNAEQTLGLALDAYRESEDTYGETRGRILRILIVEARDGVERALDEAEKVHRLAEANGHQRLVISARLEQGRLLVKADRADDGLKALANGLGQAVLLGDRSAEFLAHYHLWKAHEQLGQKQRARIALESAMHFVQGLDDSSTEADEIRRLMEG